MDAVTGLLDGGREAPAFVLTCRLASPYAVRIADEAPLAVVVPVDHPVHVVLLDGGEPEEGEPPVTVAPGDVVLLRGPQPYVLTDTLGTEPLVTILPGQVCTTPDGTHVDGMAMLGARSWGAPTGARTFLTGVYETPAQVSERLLRVLPRVALVEGGDWSAPLVSLMAGELTRDVVGQEAVLDRLVDLLLVSALREWFARDPGRAPGWYLAQGDVVVGAVLALIHDQPSRPWTLETLAREVGSSRSGLARRFAQIVGEPPMSYLTHWRLDLAADLLVDRTHGDLTLEAVAHRVGYGSAFALSAAFKRERGMSPRAFRAG